MVVSVSDAHLVVLESSSLLKRDLTRLLLEKLNIFCFLLDSTFEAENSTLLDFHGKQAGRANRVNNPKNVFDSDLEIILS